MCSGMNLSVDDVRTMKYLADRDWIPPSAVRPPSVVYEKFELLTGTAGFYNNSTLETSQ